MMKMPSDFFARCTPWFGAVLLAATTQGAVQEQKAVQPATSSRQPAPKVELDPKLSSYLEEHCYDCHDATTQKGDFRIDTLSSKIGFENTPQWLEIMERINSGEMPPKKVKTRPT